MREPPYIIKAINALRGVSYDEPITRVPYIREAMADILVEKGYATRAPWSKDETVPCFRLTLAGVRALQAKSAPKSKLKMLEPRLKPIDSRLKPIGKN